MSMEEKTQDGAQNTTTASVTFDWDAITILQSTAIFVLAGFAEIIGGWLIWISVKGVRIEEVSNNEVNSGVNNSTAINGSIEPPTATGETSQYIILKKPRYFAFLGSLTLVVYGFIPCLQPSAASDGFARIYAAYGGFFVVLSYLLGWVLEGESAKPDIGDLVGGFISLVGVGVIMFWPRN